MIRLAMATVMLVAGFMVHADSGTIPTKEVFLTINDALVPETTKPNGDSYVVVSGMFPNSCYKWNRAEVRDLPDNNHDVRLVGTVSQQMCMMVLVPFTKEVVLGKLPAGEHKLKFINGDDTYFERTLVVQ